MAAAELTLKPTANDANSKVLAAIAIYVILNGGLLVATSTPLFRPVFVATSLLLGLFLYRTGGPGYTVFTLMIWFFSPFIRRVSDLKLGWSDPSIILLAPYLVVLISVISIKDILLPSVREFLLPFSLIMLALAMSIVVGLFLLPLNGVITGTLGWLTPPLFGLYLMTRADRYIEYRSAVINAVTVAGLVMAIYGIVQFIVAPAWDRYWLENVIPELVAPSFGQPEPYEIRVFSTLNSPGPLSTALVMTILLLLTRNKLWLILPNFVALMLSQVRSAWLALVGGLFALLFIAPRDFAMQIRIRVVLMLGGILTAAMLLLTTPIMGDLVGERLDTFKDLQHDESLKGRSEMQAQMLNWALDHPLGMGMNHDVAYGDLAIDGALASMLFTLGIPGTILFVTGVVLLIRLMIALPIVDRDTSVVRLGAYVLLVLATAGNAFIGPIGIFTWTMMALTLSARSQRRADGPAAPPSGLSFVVPQPV